MHDASMQRVLAALSSAISEAIDSVNKDNAENIKSQLKMICEKACTVCYKQGMIDGVKGSREVFRASKQ